MAVITYTNPAGLWPDVQLQRTHNGFAESNPTARKVEFAIDLPLRSGLQKIT